MKMKILASAVAVSSVLLGGMNSALADTVIAVNRILSITPVNRGTTTINGVTVTADTSRWLQNSAQRLAGAQWRFNDNGTFVFHLPNSRTDVYPITGKYRIQGNQLIFQGSKTASTNVSRTSSFVGGSLNLNSPQPVMNIQWGTSATTAAVISGSRYGSAKTSAYDAKVLIKRMR